MLTAMRSKRISRRNGLSVSRSKKMITARWSCRFFPTGRSATGSMPMSRKCAAGPMPESMRRCGVLKAPPARITSRLACARATSPPALTYSTPVAPAPWVSTRVACAPVSTVRFPRFLAGLRNAVAADER